MYIVREHMYAQCNAMTKKLAWYVACRACMLHCLMRCTISMVLKSCG